MADDLSTPLKSRTDRRKVREARAAQAPATLWQRLPVARVLFALTAIILVAVVAYQFVATHSPDGGRPGVEAPIAHVVPANPLAEQLASVPPTITIPPETMSGAKVIKVDPSLAGGGDEDDDSAGLSGPTGVFADLAEDTANGPIPRVSAAGVTPFSAYRRASVTPATSSKPLVAIVVTGLGLNENGTMEAITALPATLSLAFAPYGKTLDRTVAAARDDGHELLLEIPLEPFDYPQNDPGPETLLTGQPARANLNKLFWLMARIGGYVGVVNHMGARFTASGGDFSPIMEELGTRGLGYLDDGSSNRSVAAQLAATSRVPFGRADLLVDATPSRSAILAALDELVNRARTDGRAIGIATALPVTIKTLSEWAETAEDKGVLLVPVSALMQ